MANVVMTGSTRRIGLGLARECPARGHAVMISGRPAAIVEAVARLDQMNQLDKSRKDLT